MSAAEAGGGEGFTFHELDVKFPAWEQKENKDLLAKWGVDQYSCLKKYRYEEYLEKEQINNFLLSFFKSPAVQGSAQVCSSQGTMNFLGRADIKGVTTKELSCKVTSMEFFDKLKHLGRCSISFLSANLLAQTLFARLDKLKSASTSTWMECRSVTN